MRFFVTGNIKKNKALYTLILSLLIFLSLFWLSNWLYYHYTFGLTIEKLKTYFFGFPDYPETISFSTLLEDLHVFFFLNFFFYFIASSIFNMFTNKLGKFFIPLSFLFLCSDIFLSFFILKFPSLLILKLTSFYFFQLFTGVLLTLSIYFSVKGNTTKASEENLKVLVFIFSSFAILFIILALLLFKEKLGLSVSSVKEYFMGNEEKFIKPKSFEGIFKTFYLHILSIPLFAFALSHFLPFTKFKVSKLLLISVIFIPLFEQFTSFLVRFLNSNFAYLKIFLLFTSVILIIYASLLIISDLLKD